MYTEESAMINTARETQVSSQMAEMERNISLLNKTIESLFSRLQNVTRDMLEEKPTDRDVPEQHLVPLADQVRSYAREIKRLTEKLRTLDSSLEL